jgi:ABC-type multidrug transport system permease subunit
MLAVVRRDAQRAASYRTAVIGAFASELVSLILFYYVSRLVHVAEFDPDEYFAFVVVGLIALQLATAVVTYPLFILSTELVSGNFERVVVSPLGAVLGLVTTLVFPFLTALVGSVAVMGFAVAVFDLQLHWATVPLALPAALLVGLSFAPLGLLLLAGGVLLKQAAVLAGWVITALSLVAGLYFPIALLPGWIQWASDVQPLTPAVDLMRHLLVGSPLSDPALAAGKLAAFAAVLIPPSLWVLSRAIDRGRQRATIIEY